MSTPSTITMKTFNGEFTMNKKLSSNTEGLLSLQGVPFIARKALSVANVTLNCKTSTSGSGKIQVKTLLGNKETQDADVFAPDNVPHKSESHAFGEISRQSKYIGSLSELQATLSEATSGSELAPTAAEDAEDAKWLAGGWGSQSVAEGLLVITVVSKSKKWVSRSVWGFMDVEGERKYVRLSLVRKGGKKEASKMVYDFGGAK